MIQLFDISCRTDPLVHHGRHFGRTVHALCNVCALINNGLLYMGELSEQPEENFTHECVLLSFFWTSDPFLAVRERREHRVFQVLLQMIPGLEERLVEGSEENVIHVAELVCFHISYWLYVTDTRRSRKVLPAPDPMILKA